MLTLLEGVILPVGLSIVLAPHFRMTGVLTAMIASECAAAFLILGYLVFDARKSRITGKRIFLLPETDDRKLCEFTVKMDIPEIVQTTQEVSQYIEDRTDHRTAVITCLALEEMLTGITMANNNQEDVIDVMLRQSGTDIIISVRDAGIGFNPLVRDEHLAYEFDNVSVLQRIAAEIRYDLSLGMNDTMIRLSGKK